eukprot:scaffold84201_cov32-Tisochrysis_lutea.AAC.5
MPDLRHPAGCDGCTNCPDCLARDPQVPASHSLARSRYVLCLFALALELSGLVPRCRAVKQGLSTTNKGGAAFFYAVARCQKTLPPGRGAGGATYT